MIHGARRAGRLGEDAHHRFIGQRLGPGGVVDLPGRFLYPGQAHEVLEEVLECDRRRLGRTHRGVTMTGR